MVDFTLTVPEDVYNRAQQIAEETERPVEQVLLEHLKMLSPLPALPADEEAELAALAHLSDDALWTIAREQMPDDLKAHMQVLMDKNSLGAISASEYEELQTLVDRGQRLMIRKSEAATLLTRRGYKVTPKDMASLV